MRSQQSELETSSTVKVAYFPHGALSEAVHCFVGVKPFGVTAHHADYSKNSGFRRKLHTIEHLFELKIVFWFFPPLSSNVQEKGIVRVWKTI